MRLFTILSICVATLVPSSALLAQTGTSTETETPQYSLTLEEGNINPGESITVNYENDVVGNNFSDWIGLYRASASDTQYIRWKYVSGNSGSVTFSVSQTGTYEFRYFSGGGYNRVAVSDDFTVTEAGDDGDDGNDGGDDGGGDDGDDGETYLLTLSTDSITVGGSISADYESTLPKTGDWIGLYRASASDTQYIRWKYVSGNSGSVTFSVSQTGTYEFRYFSGGGYNRVAVSDDFTVTEAGDDGDDGNDGGDDGGGDDGDDGETYLLTLSTDSITVGGSISADYESTLPKTGDWIGLYRASASDTQYIRWKYVSGNSGSVTFSVSQTGTYEFRYFSGGGYNRVAVSDDFTVTEAGDDGDDGNDGGDDGGGDDGDDGETYLLTLSTDSITVGGSISADYESTLPKTGDWIGLYRASASDTQYIRWKYVSGNSGSVTFSVSQTGTYEFRYFSGGGYNRVAVSDDFTVTEAGDDGDDGNDGGDDGATSYSLTPNKTQYERGEIARVTWDVPSGESFFLNWIGLYEPGTADTSYLDYEYVDSFSRTETFRLDNDGLYEFRFFTNNSYNRVAVSDRITVFNDTSASCNIDTSDITNFPPSTGPIVAFGDSLTFGIGATEGEDYVSELEDRLGASIINAGISGDTTRDALARLDSDVLSQNPSAVIVFLGGNDEIRRFYEQLSDNLADRNLKDNLDQLAERIGYNWMDVPLIPREETFANIESMIEQIQATGAVTILVGFDTSIYDATIADDYQAIADNTNSFYVPDIFEGVFGRPRFMSDLVHPNDAGYDFFADRIQPAVACVLP